MKKITVICLSTLMALSLAACGNSSQNRAEDTPAESQTAALGAESENNGADSAEQNVVSADQNPEGVEGNSTQANTGTEAGDGDTAGTGDGNILVAYFSVMETDGLDTVGGDLFSIETVQEYPTTHEPLLSFAYEEKAGNARPELATHIENPDSYDVIFLGFPNWNADLPMPLYTFLEEYDFSGKTIIPFTTHGGSGFSRTVQTIAELQPDADVLSEGLSISRNSVSGAESAVIDWVNGLSIIGRNN